MAQSLILRLIAYLSYQLFSARTFNSGQTKLTVFRDLSDCWILFCFTTMQPSTYRYYWNCFHGHSKIDKKAFFNIKKLKIIFGAPLIALQPLSLLAIDLIKKRIVLFLLFFYFKYTLSFAGLIRNLSGKVVFLWLLRISRNPKKE